MGGWRGWRGVTTNHLISKKKNNTYKIYVTKIHAGHRSEHSKLVNWYFDNLLVFLTSTPVTPYKKERTTDRRGEGETERERDVSFAP